MEREYYGRRRRASFGFSVCCPKCDTELMRTCLSVDEVLECPKCGYKMYVFVDKDMCIMMPQEQTDNTQIVNQMRQFVTAAGHGDFESCDDCQQFNDDLRISDLMESYDRIEEITEDLTDLLKIYCLLCFGFECIKFEDIEIICECLSDNQDVDIRHQKDGIRITRKKAENTKNKRYRIASRYISANKTLQNQIRTIKEA